MSSKSNSTKTKTTKKTPRQGKSSYQAYLEAQAIIAKTCRAEAARLRKRRLADEAKAEKTPCFFETYLKLFPAPFSAPTPAPSPKSGASEKENKK